MKVGVEAEYWVVDETGALSDGRELVDAHEHVDPEFIASLIEIKTPPVESESALRHVLQSTLQAVLAAADARGMRLVPLGTPLADSSSPVVSERGRLLDRIYGEGIKPATQCAGTHVHFDAENVPRQVNLLTAFDPALALVSSSPWYAGEHSMHASRPYVYRSLCGEEFVQFRDLWEYTTDVAAWDDRLATAYETFRTLALDRGVTDQEFTTHFQPENTMATPVRVRQQFPTIEWRAPDTALPSQIVKLTSDVSRLVDQTASKPVEIGEPGVGSHCITIPAFDDRRAGIVLRRPILPVCDDVGAVHRRRQGCGVCGRLPDVDGAAAAASSELHRIGGRTPTAVVVEFGVSPASEKGQPLEPRHLTRSNSI